jgi:hypothetical protein
LSLLGLKVNFLSIGLIFPAGSIFLPFQVSIEHSSCQSDSNDLVLDSLLANYVVIYQNFYKYYYSEKYGLFRQRQEIEGPDREKIFF